MTPFLQIAVHEQSQVGEARRAAGRVALRLGFDETLTGRVALVVTELASNLARHARGGRMLIGEAADGALELLSLDDGPGMASLDTCLRDGYSTAGTPGTGLGAARRLADVFSAYSVVGKGTVIYARLGGTGGVMPTCFRYAGIGLAAPGEQVSGDGWRVRVDEARVAVFVVDGLGHGPQAAEASDAALQVFAAAPVDASPSQTLERAHAAMRATRGAAGALAVLDANAGALRYAGAGNITGRLMNALEDRTLLSQHGTLGLQIRKPQDMEYAWPEHGLLVMHSDGIVTRWNLDDAPGLLQCEPAVLAGWLLLMHVRGRDDATVVVLRRVR
ncbi:ATP-binding SpoIIE family protein phosphatase [Paucibacter sp. R3-3]|uniref:ATP-binding SpoIIE family protein phosphatase n=1 Tax=Roseateles agri TaxID=3098619 RepID=A0ABU5DQL3_9BURK|nr:ATP-binding SpoIIE family protein phosphatase [Paucibacter sp. R3-3]MDY0748610.1 ATP-binding SpoIIE family protein phosphatase [Paucibacter sp. R3-3]